jgi:dGTPase
VADPELQRRRVIAAVIDLATSDLIERSARALESSGVRSPAELSAAAEPLIGFSPEMYARTREVARFLLHHFYRHPEVLRMVEEAERVLRELWAKYVDDPGLLPPEVREWGRDEPPQRQLVDYVAGMTDRYAIDEHRRLHA